MKILGVILALLIVIAALGWLWLRGPDIPYATLEAKYSAHDPASHFVDLPGVDAADSAAWTTLRNQLAAFPSPYVHLVLNAAYETDTLLAQYESFAGLNPTDVIVTHLDEEPRRVKLWNLILGTNCTIRFLSAGQKIPGEFQDAKQVGIA